MKNVINILVPYGNNINEMVCGNELIKLNEKELNYYFDF